MTTAREYVRQTQQRLIVAPLLAQVRSAYPERAAVEGHLLVLLAQLRAWADYAQGYGPANVLALLREQCGHLRGVDLSQLSIRGAYLQGIEMQDASLAGATVRDTTFTEAFDATWAVASKASVNVVSRTVAPAREASCISIPCRYAPRMESCDRSTPRRWPHCSRSSASTLAGP